jgi:uncharacterized coiled-coil DUF342 family protein
MERAVAIKKLTKLFGKKLGYRVNANAPSADERAVAKEQVAAAVAERNKLKEARDERHRAILAADAEYQNLHAAHKEASERVDKLYSVTRHYKITIGELDQGFFFQRAEGDSWEEVIAKLTEKQNA